MKEIKDKILICGSDFIKAFNKAIKSGKLKNYYKNNKNKKK